MLLRLQSQFLLRKVFSYSQYSFSLKLINSLILKLLNSPCSSWSLCSFVLEKLRLNISPKLFLLCGKQRRLMDYGRWQPCWVPGQASESFPGFETITTQSDDWHTDYIWNDSFMHTGPSAVQPWEELTAHNPHIFWAAALNVRADWLQSPQLRFKNRRFHKKKP